MGEKKRNDLEIERSGFYVDGKRKRLCLSG